LLDCLLVRHAAHDLVDRVLVGRMDGVALNDLGREQALALRARLESFDILAVQSSPRQRAIETAAIIAGARGLEVTVCPALDEVDFGVWTGLSFADLTARSDWSAWNSARESTRPPLGETMPEAQKRITSYLDDMHASQPKGCIVMVTHAELIRAALLHVMALPLDDWARLDIPPASIARLQIRSRKHSVVGVSGGKVAA
jgi:broad specificity phosphatase PhoE